MADGIPPRCPECGEPVTICPSTFQGEWFIRCTDGCGYKLRHRETAELAWQRHLERWNETALQDDEQPDTGTGPDVESEGGPESDTWGVGGDSSGHCGDGVDE